MQRIYKNYILTRGRRLEAYRIKLELKTINKLTIIDAEKGKINELTEGYANARRAKKELLFKTLSMFYLSIRKKIFKRRTLNRIESQDFSSD